MPKAAAHALALSLIALGEQTAPLLDWVPDEVRQKLERPRRIDT